MRLLLLALLFSQAFVTTSTAFGETPAHDECERVWMQKVLGAASDDVLNAANNERDVCYRGVGQTIGSAKNAAAAAAKAPRFLIVTPDGFKVSDTPAGSISQPSTSSGLELSCLQNFSACRLEALACWEQLRQCRSQVVGIFPGERVGEIVPAAAN